MTIDNGAGVGALDVTNGGIYSGAPKIGLGTGAAIGTATINGLGSTWAIGTSYLIGAGGVWARRPCSRAALSPPATCSSEN